MKIIPIIRFLSLVLVAFACSLQAQSQKKKSTDPKPEDARKMIEKAKEEISNDPDMDADQKAMLLKMMNSKTVKDATKAMEDPANQAKVKQVYALKKEMTGLPAPDQKRLATIPSKTFTKTELTQYANSLTQKLQGAIPAASKASAQQLIAKANGNSAYLVSEAIAAWYGGSPEEALLLSAKSVSLSPDANAINNLGAMLNMAGQEEKAIPLLTYAIERDTANASLYNNLGRAWLGLGEKKKAKQMLLLSVHYAPHQPEANNSLGCLYEAEGNKTEAISSYEKSLEGAYNENAYKHLTKLKPDFDLPKLIKFHYRAPKYFDQFAIRVPMECTSIDQMDSVKKIHEAFQNGLANLGNLYAEMENAENENTKSDWKAVQQNMLDALETGKRVQPPIAPFGTLAAMMLEKLTFSFADEKQLAIRDYKKSYQELIDGYIKSANAIKQKYKALKDACIFEGEGGINEVAKFDRYSREECDAQKKLADKAQSGAATLHNTFKIRYKRLVLDYYDNRMYWISLTSPMSSLVNQQIYRAINDFIGELKFLSSTTPFIELGYVCITNNYNGTTGADEFSTNKKPDCPISINIAFLVGKLSLDCTSFGISGGEGLKLGYKKDFTNGQSTLSVGAGITAQVGTGKVNAGVSADESIYVTFNGEGQPCDVGLKMDANAGVNAGPISASAEAGYTMGMNSGFNFTQSALSGSLNL